jgi:hypothetical protein
MDVFKKKLITLLICTHAIFISSSFLASSTVIQPSEFPSKNISEVIYNFYPDVDSLLSNSIKRTFDNYKYSDSIFPFELIESGDNEYIPFFNKSRLSTWNDLTLDSSLISLEIYFYKFGVEGFDPFFRMDLVI